MTTRFGNFLSCIFNCHTESRISLVLFFLTPLILYSGMAPLRDLYGIEARNALFAREMLENGISFVPQLMGRPYPDYPPLYFILEYLFSLPAGRVTTLSAVLPSALSAAGTVYLLWRWMSGTYEYLAAMACMVLALSPGFYLKASHATVDMLLTFEATLALYLLSRLWKGDDDINRRFVLMTATVLTLLAAFFTKGPVGIVIPLGGFGLYLLTERKWNRMLRFSLFATACGILLTGIYFMFIYLQGGWPLVSRVITSQITTRIGTEPNRPFYYYAVYLFTSFLPWWLLIALLPKLMGRKAWTGAKSCVPTQAAHFLAPSDRAACMDTVRICAAGTSVTLSIFMMASSRHGRYLLPAFPLIAVLIAAGIRAIGTCNLRRYGHITPNPRAALHTFHSLALTVSLTAAAMSAGLVLYSLFIEPGISAAESGRRFMQEVDANTPPDVPMVIYRINPDGNGIKLALYSDRGTDRLKFPRTPDELGLVDSDDLVVIMYGNELDELPHPQGIRMRTVATGTVHRKKIIALHLHRDPAEELKRKNHNMESQLRP